MWLKSFAAFILASAPIGAFAQNLTVRTGEHENFTRLVAPIPLGGDWQVEQDGRKVTLSIDGFDGEFNTAGVFQLVPRERIISVISNPGMLTITLGCDCSVAPFVSRGRYIVVDVAEPGTELVGDPLEPNFNMPEKLDNVVTESIAFSDAPVTPATTRNETVIELALPLNPKRTRQSTSHRLKPVDLPGRFRTPLPEGEQTALQETQQRLAEELSTAATRGVLNLLPGRALRNWAPISSGADEIVTEKRSARPTAAPESTNNMRVTSSNDIPILMRNSQEALSITGLVCASDIEVGVAHWADDRPFHEQIGEARQNLFGEFDKLDRKWAIKSAKIYIHFGFGAEALQILALDTTLAASEPLLVDLAHIIEKGSAPEHSSLSNLIDCETDVSLWAIIARENLDLDRVIDPRAALLALNKLPVHLRQFIAPALSQRLLSRGDTGAASTALRNLERLPSSLATAAKLAKANIAIDKGNFEKGARALEDVIDDNVAQSPQALITFVETQLAAKQPVDPETADLVEAFAKELKDSELGPALRRAHVLALVKSAQFDRAFAAISALDGSTEETAAVELRLRVLEEVTIAAEDVVFLEYMFEQDSVDIDRLPTRSKLAIVTRLIELGFAGRAEPIIAGIPPRPYVTDRQILLARMALMLERPGQAIEAVADTQSNQADEIRAQAQLLSGAYGEASALFRRNDQSEAAVSAAWLADDLDRRTLSDDPVFGPVIALVDTPTEVTGSSAGMLERSDAALKESETARQTLQSFLAIPLLEVSEEPAQ